MTATRVAYIFPGQGLQYAGMGQSLVEHSEHARYIGAQISNELTNSGYPADILQLMRTDQVDLPLHTQVAVYTHSILAWSSFKAAMDSRAGAIEPVVTAGHSAGELAALVAAGALGPSAMARIVYTRSQLMNDAPPGALINIELPIDQVQSLMNSFHQESQNERVYLSLIQGTALTAVGGSLRAAELFSAFLTSQSVAHRWVVGVTKPLHTPLQSALRKQFKTKLETIKFQPFHVPVLSNTSGELYSKDDIAETLASQLDNTVRFASIIERISKLAPELYILFGPAEKLVELLSVYNEVSPQLIRVVNTRADLRDVVSELCESKKLTTHDRYQNLISAIEDILTNNEEDVHLVLDQFGRVRSVADVVQDRESIVICKGSFNPIHNLHIDMLRAVRTQRRSSVALFALSSDTAKGELSSRELASRIRLIHYAGFPVLLSRTGYFYRNFAYLKKVIPEKDIVFVAGSDVLTRLLDYFTPEEFGSRLGGSHFVCGVRGDVAALKSRVSSQAEYSGITFLPESLAADVSSTQIRNLRQKGLFGEIRRLMPARVAEAYLASPDSI